MLVKILNYEFMPKSIFISASQQNKRQYNLV